MRGAKHPFSRSLRPLFFPHWANTADEHPAWDATAPQAARAIVNFLVTGDPQWDSVMSEG